MASAPETPYTATFRWSQCRSSIGAKVGAKLPTEPDSLLAKVISHGRDRPEAIARMRRALEMTVIDGVETTIPLHLRILRDPDFLEGRFTTAFLERFVGPPPGD